MTPRVGRFLVLGLLGSALGCGSAGQTADTPVAPGPQGPTASEQSDPVEPSSSSAEGAKATPRESAAPIAGTSATPPPSTASSSSTAPTPSPAPASSAAPTADAPPPYHVPVRTPEELAGELRAACERSKADKRPVLLELGAAWCKDCRRLGALARSEPLAEELSHWERVEVNITDPEPHEELLSTFGVRAIAHWEALVPTKCDASVGRWQRIGSRTVEPKKSDTATAEQLAKWLRSARKRAGASK